MKKIIIRKEALKWKSRKNVNALKNVNVVARKAKNALAKANANVKTVAALKNHVAVKIIRQEYILFFCYNVFRDRYE